MPLPRSPWFVLKVLKQPGFSAQQDKPEEQTAMDTLAIPATCWRRPHSMRPAAIGQQSKTLHPLSFSQAVCVPPPTHLFQTSPGHSLAPAVPEPPPGRAFQSSRDSSTGRAGTAFSTDAPVAALPFSLTLPPFLCNTRPCDSLQHSLSFRGLVVRSLRQLDSPTLFDRRLFDSTQTPLFILLRHPLQDQRRQQQQNFQKQQRHLRLSSNLLASARTPRFDLPPTPGSPTVARVPRTFRIGTTPLVVQRQASPTEHQSVTASLPGFHCSTSNDLFV